MEKQLKNIHQFASYNETTKTATFKLSEPEVWGEHSEEAEQIQEAVWAMFLDASGYLQGHPLDESDLSYIHIHI